MAKEYKLGYHWVDKCKAIQKFRILLSVFKQPSW